MTETPVFTASAEDLADPALRDRAVRAARGQAPFDRLIVGGMVADIATGEFRRADVGLVGPMIASVHDSGSRTDATDVLDATGLTVAPGLIDMHMHIESSMVTPRRYAETVVPQGTTTVCWDPHEVGNVMGLDGVRWAIDASRNLPLRVLVLAPSCVPSAPGLERAGAVVEGAEMATMLSWPEVAGVAEVMDMRGVLDRTAHMTGVVGAGLDSGKLVCGHGRGLAGAELQGFAAAGIASDHEITSGADILAKLRAGFTVELRGSHDYVLPEVVEALLSLPQIPQTLCICTDDIFPDDLVRAGGMNDVLRRLIAYGLPPMQALRAATLNAAMRLGRGDLGLVAPGRRADLVLLSDVDAMQVAHVFASGHHVAAEGQLKIALRPDTVPVPLGTVKVPALRPDDFRIPMVGPGRLRSVVQPRFTRWGEISVAMQDGFAVLPAGTLMMAVIHRHGQAPATPVLGVLEGWGDWTGAIATTIAHDSHNLMVFGRSPDDMAAVANALVGSEGGLAVAQGGRVTTLLPLPACGLLSDAPTTEVAALFMALKQAAEAVAPLPPPLSVIKAVVGASLACNPGPHVTDIGITDGSTGEVHASAVMA